MSKRSPVRVTKPPVPAPARGEPILIGNRREQVRVAIIVVLVATVSVYLPTLYSADFVALDDGQYVVQNELVRHPSPAGIARVFSEVAKPSSVAGYYQPLTMLSLMVDSLISGDEPNPRIFHGTNLLLHALNAVLVMLVLRAACGGFVIPAAAALIWALHPIQVESVSWISQRKTLLATALALGAIRFHLLYGVTHRARWRWLTVLMYVLAGLAKPTVMFVPVLLLMLDIWPLRRINDSVSAVGAFLEKWPLWIVMAVTMYVAVLSQASTANVGLPAISRLGGMALLMAVNSVLYVRHLLWPRDLSLIYAMPSDLSLSNATVLICLLLFVAGIAAWLSSWRWSRAVFVGVGAAGLQLVLAIGPVSFMQSQVGDRFMYLPLACLMLPLAAGATRLWRRRGMRAGVAVALALLSLALLTPVTLAQQEAWVNTERLWASVLVHLPDQSMANAGLAGERLSEAEQLSAAGRKDEAGAKLNEALALANRAIAADPQAGANYDTRGRIYLQLKRASEAIADLQAALKLGMGPLEMRGRITLGKALIAEGQADAARRMFDDMLTGSARVPAGLQMEMGMTFAEAGLLTDAIRYYESATKADPDDIGAQQSLAAAAAAAGDWPRAAAAYRHTLSMLNRAGMKSPALELGLGKVLLEQHDAAGAAPFFDKAQTDFPIEARFGMAGVAALSGKADVAFSLLQEAIQRDPSLAGRAWKKSYFDGLHGDPRWLQVVGAEAASQPVEAMPSGARP